MKLVLILLGILAFLLSYVLPMALLPAAIAGIFNPLIGVIAAIAYTVIYGMGLWFLWKVFKGEIVTDHPSV